MDLDEADLEKEGENKDNIDKLSDKDKEDIEDNVTGHFFSDDSCSPKKSKLLSGLFVILKAIRHQFFN